MYEQYPHTIYLEIAGEPTSNEDGYLEPTEPAQLISECRAEPNSKGQSVASGDGSVIIPSSIVYLPFTELIIPFGTKGTLVKGGRSENIVVKRFEPGTFNSRIWL